MKGKWVRLLLLGGLLAATLTVTALAAIPDYTDDIEGTVTADLAEELLVSYTASCTDGVTDGDPYLLLVVELEDYDHPENRRIGADTILYIEQVTGAQIKEGVAFLPRRFRNSVVLLGGTFSGGTSPKVLGKIAAQGVTVSGPVTVQGPTPATVVLYDEDGVELDRTAAAGGHYSFGNLLPGRYTIKAFKSCHLTATKTVTVEKANVTEPLVLPCGDANNSGGINVEDLSAVLRDYGKSTAEARLPGSDVNESGGVNVEDLSQVLRNYGK